MNKSLTLKKALSLSIKIVNGDILIKDGKYVNVGSQVTASAVNALIASYEEAFVTKFAYRKNAPSISTDEVQVKTLPCNPETPLMIEWPNGMFDVIKAKHVDCSVEFKWKPHTKSVIDLAFPLKEDNGEDNSKKGTANYWLGMIELHAFDREKFANFLANNVTINK